MATRNPGAQARIKAIARAADDRKAEHIVILDVDKISSIARYFVFCTGTSNRQTVAIHDAVYDALNALGEKPLHVEGLSIGSWVLMDYGDIIIHIFMPDVRDFYDLEGLWRDAKPVNVEKLVGRESG